jgi:hypothetical protein
LLTAEGGRSKGATWKTRCVRIDRWAEEWKDWTPPSPLTVLCAVKGRQRHTIGVEVEGRTDGEARTANRMADPRWIRGAVVLPRSPCC